MLPLVAGLFVLVEGLVRTGIVQDLTRALQALTLSSPAAGSWASGLIAALACNLMNNLPVGLIAGSTITAFSVPTQVASALLVGVDLGPNLSIPDHLPRFSGLSRCGGKGTMSPPGISCGWAWSSRFPRWCWRWQRLA